MMPSRSWPFLFGAPDDVGRMDSRAAPGSVRRRSSRSKTAFQASAKTGAHRRGRRPPGDMRADTSRPAARPRSASRRGRRAARRWNTPGAASSRCGPRFGRADRRQQFGRGLVALGDRLRRRRRGSFPSRDVSMSRKPRSRSCGEDLRNRDAACRKRAVDRDEGRDRLRRMRDLGIGLAVADRRPEHQRRRVHQHGAARSRRASPSRRIAPRRRR